MVGQVAQNGLRDLIFLAAFLSVNLGLLNLFPIPVLDGGRIVLDAIEGITGRPVHEKVQEMALQIGFLLMIGLFLFTSWQDLMRLESLQNLLRFLGVGQ
jgi:regulator of sigma E protease